MTTFSSSPAADWARCTAVNVLPALWFELTTASVRGLPAPSSTMRLVRRTRNASTSSMPEPFGILASTGQPGDPGDVGGVLGAGEAVARVVHEHGELGHDDERDDERQERVPQRLRRDRGVGRRSRRRRCRACRPCGCGSRSRPRSARRSDPGWPARSGEPAGRSSSCVWSCLRWRLDRLEVGELGLGLLRLRSCRSATTTRSG